MGDAKSHATPEKAADEATGSSTASQIRPRKPLIFGGYELLSRLRVGGMAELYRARELRDSARLVAIKRILPSFTDEADYVAMFVDEARLALRLKHPGIVEAYEIGQVEDELFIALELVQGKDVGALLARARESKQPLPVGIACRIALEVCSALHYAHELRDERGAPLRIVHRDVSPQNILVSYDGEVKLIDFGIAKSSEQLMRTQAGLLKGKHGYLSPEQAQAQPVGRQSDLFSLGVCLYEMLCAERLFQGSSDFSTIVKVRKAEVPRLRDRNPAVPDGLAAIVEKALAREPGDRFATAAEMASALLHFVSESGERCERAGLAEFMRQACPPSEAGEPEPENANDPHTGLLDAFAAVEPPTAVSALSALEAPPELVPEPAPDELEEIGEDEAIASEASDEEYEDVGDIAHPSQDPLREPYAAEPMWEHDEDASDSSATLDLGEPPSVSTRVVEYESTLEGQLARESENDEPTNVGPRPEPDAPAQAGADESSAGQGEITRPRGRTPSRPQAAPNVPAVGLEWDDEEMSTHLYDEPGRAPSPVPAVAAASAATVAAAEARSRLPTPPARPAASYPPSAYSSPPGAASGALGAHASVRPRPRYSTPPVIVSQPLLEPQPQRRSPTTAPPRAMPSAPMPSTGLALLGFGLIALALGAGFLFMREPASAGLRLVTDPVDAEVLLDGIAIGGSASPFVENGVKPEVTHVIEVRKSGYKSWRTQLVLHSGQQLDLPTVSLMREEPALRPARFAPQPPAMPAPAPAPRVEAPPPPAVTAKMPIKETTRTAPVPRARPAPASPMRAHALKVAAAETGGGTGTLRINSRPWSRVYIDGRLVGNTPQTSLTLSAGRHTVTLVNPDFNLRKVLTVELARGESVTKIVSLEP